MPRTAGSFRDMMMTDKKDKLVLALERLKKTPAPNYPIKDYAPISASYIQELIDKVGAADDHLIADICSTIINSVSDIHLDDEDTTTDQLKYQYAVSKVRECARIDSEINDKSPELFVKQSDYEEDIEAIKKGIEFVQATVDSVRLEIQTSRLSGFSVNLGPIGIPLDHVSKTASAASVIIASSIGVDAVALTVQLRGMTSSAALAFRKALQTASVPIRVTELLRAITERAADTAELGLSLLRRALGVLGSETDRQEFAAAAGVGTRGIGFGSEIIGMDFGTSALRLSAKGRGLVCSVDSVPEVRGVSISRNAWLSTERWSDRPVMAGVIADGAVAESILKQAASKSGLAKRFSRPHIIASASSSSTAVEIRAIRRVAKSLPAGKVEIVDGILASALGCGIDIHSLEGAMVGDLGAGKSEVGIVALSGIIHSNRVKVGGDDLTSKIQQYLSRVTSTFLSFEECEAIKLRIANSGYGQHKADPYEIVGFNKLSKSRMTTSVTSEMVADAISEPLHQIIDIFKLAIEATPPELAHNIQRTGIIICGGASKLPGMAKAISDHTGMPVSVAIDPEGATSRGLSFIMENRLQASVMAFS